VTAPGGGTREYDIQAMYFSDVFGIDPADLHDYGAFDISVISDLPLFIDPFLLFNSDDPEYQELHHEIIRYLSFLWDKATSGSLDAGLLKYWYQFKEVKQNWLGFTTLGNGGLGLGPEFAESLHKNLARLFNAEGSLVTSDFHLEKASLIREGVGRDGISDLTTNLIKEFLLQYTEAFTLAHIDEERRRLFRVSKVRFNYETESWEEGSYTLPSLGTGPDDFVLLTPSDILTRDDTWINRGDLFNGFENLPASITDAELRSQVSNYFHKQLAPKASKKQRDAAAQATIDRFPQLLDYYIALKELDGKRATAVSELRVQKTDEVFVGLLHSTIVGFARSSDLFGKPITSYEEALIRVQAFKQYIENQDGYQLINKGGKSFGNEKEVQLFFGLVFANSTFDVNREPNNGRGPVDFKLSKGAFDKTLIEIKLGRNSQLKRNLEKQVEIYQAANQTPHAVKVIVNFTADDERRVAAILKDLKMDSQENVVVIDARADNKPSASKA
jgi:hypothetical protein